LNDSQLHAFLNSDHAHFSEVIAEDIETHLSEIQKPVTGYAILTGEDDRVESLVAAYDSAERSMPLLERLLGEKFDVHAWQMSPQTFERANSILDEINAQFRSLHPKRDDSAETDATEITHVYQLHQAIIKGFSLAKQRVKQLQRRRVFKVFCIPDSMLDVDLRASKELNSRLIHVLYRVWR
jgi:hypothetical protein